VTDADAALGRVGVVIVAGGAGTRLGADVPKAFVRVAGRTLLSYAVERVAQVAGLASLVIVAPESHCTVEAMADVMPVPEGTIVVPGGAERSDSVRIGLERIDPSCGAILIHDAARCFTPVTVFERVIAAVRAGDAGAVPGVSVVDTIKAVDADGLITGTPDRSALRAVQTPQGFDAKLLRAAYASGLSGTDDAALVEAIGHHVRVVDGDPLAFKVTTPEDLARAEDLVTSGAATLG
jgi:2-C-methyl-D-erythritol 4-phosphate cytidylyltransferase